VKYSTITACHVQYGELALPVFHWDADFLRKDMIPIPMVTDAGIPGDYIPLILETLQIPGLSKDARITTWEEYDKAKDEFYEDNPHLRR